MNIRTTTAAQARTLPSTFFSLFVVLLSSIIAQGCASLETRLAEAEREGRLGEAFWLAVEYYDDNIDDADDLPAARAALERVGNLYLEQLIRTAEQEINNDYFTKALSHLYQHSKYSAVAVIQAANIRDVALAKRTVPDFMYKGVYAALEAYYQRGIDIFNTGNWDAAIAHFTKMQGLKNADWYIAESQRELQYAHALAEFRAGRYRSAHAELGKLDPKYKDVAALQAKSIELGKIVVAVFGFSHDSGNAIQKKIINTLLQDVFIEVVNADNLDKFARIAPGTARTTSVDFIVNGSTALYITPVRSRPVAFEQEAWVVTDKYRIVDSSKDGYRYVREAYPLQFIQEELAIEGSMNIHYEIAEAEGFTTAVSDDIHIHSDDHTVQWTYKGRYSPNRFTVSNPALDTLLSKSTWYPSREDCKFQDYFTEQKPLISPPAMAETLVATSTKKTVEKVVQALRRLEEKKLLSTR